MKNLASISVILFLLFTACNEQQKEQKTKGDSTQTVMEQTMKENAEKYIQAWSKNDFDLMKSISVENLVRNANGEITSKNQSEIGETMKFWHTAIPDFNLAQGDIVIKGDKSYSNWTSTGTNTGKFGETPPTGKKSETQGFSVLTFNKEGKIIYEQSYYDLLGVLKQWGYSITPPPSK